MANVNGEPSNDSDCCHWDNMEHPTISASASDSQYGGCDPTFLFLDFCEESVTALDLRFLVADLGVDGVVRSTGLKG